MRIFVELRRKMSQGRPVTSGLSIPGRVLSWAILFLLLFSLLFPIQPGAAQSALNLTVQPPEANAFPEVQVPFKLTDANHHLIEGLQAADLMIVENGVELPVFDVQTDYVGVHFVLVVNGGRELDVYDGVGLSRYQKMRDALQSSAAGWRFRREDAWSLVLPDGGGIPNADNAAAWMTALDAAMPNFRQMDPDPASLATAIRLLQEEATPFGVDKVVLYLTQPPMPDQIGEIIALTEEARTAGVQVNVWMVGDAYFLTNDQGGSLLELAAATGGQFFHYTGSETLPELSSMLNALGGVQRLTYFSEIRATGTYTLTLLAEVAGAQASGESLPFTLDVQPPKLMFLAPPANLTLQPPGEKDAAELPAETVTIQFLVEYPDGRERDLVASRLLVDGTVAGVNEAPPFDAFEWDLSGISESGEHTLQVQVEDELGLAAATVLIPVQVTVDASAGSLRLSGQQVGLIMIGAVLAVSVGLLVVWLVRKIWRPHPLRLGQTRQGAPTPETGNVAALEALGAGERLAVLIPEDELAQTTEGRIEINRASVTLGADPARAGLCLPGGGLDPVQAELTWDGQAFWLRHLGAEHLTWVNGAALQDDPVQVRSGDLVHLGDLGFRFTINELSTRKVTVSKFEPFE